jgi:hypothetical protein
MKLDNDTRTVMKILIEDKLFIPRTRSLDISKFLDTDRKIDLWLLEVAVRYSIRFLIHMIIRSGKTKIHIDLVGWDNYYLLRGITDDTKGEEEFEFIVAYVDSIFKDELSPG